METSDKVMLGIVITLGVLIALSLGIAIGEHRIRKEALLIGHAHYQHDNDGAAQFTWNKK